MLNPVVPSDGHTKFMVCQESLLITFLNDLVKASEEPTVLLPQLVLNLAVRFRDLSTLKAHDRFEKMFLKTDASLQLLFSFYTGFLSFLVFNFEDRKS